MNKRKSKTYRIIEELLRLNKELRNSDKKLIWKFWELQKGSDLRLIGKAMFIQDLKSPETVRRTRQMVQADYPELASTKRVQEVKDAKQSEKGTFAYRDETDIKQADMGFDIGFGN